MENCLICLQNNQFEEIYTEIKFAKVIYKRPFKHCIKCGLVFLPKEHQVPHDFEKERYEEHDNDIAQEGYRNFLMQMWTPLKERIKTGAFGLDYGCGPTHAFTELVENEDCDIDSYDPYFEPDGIQKEQYDFVWFNEAIEHCSDPLKELKRIDQLLAPHSVLAVGTSILKDVSQFSSWGYHHDVTHITFFQEQTFEYVANLMNWQYEKVSDRVHLFKKGH